MLVRSLAAVACLGVTAACASDAALSTPTTDAASRSPADAGPLGDAEALRSDDAAGAGSPRDAGEPDADGGSPSPDARVVIDAGSTDAGPAHVVRFVALGDTGEGNQAQYDVASALNMVCLVQGCDFVMLLGDNFYDDGVRSATDDQFRTKFEEPYAQVHLPFYVTLGNHDFGEIPLQFWRTDFQIEYSARSAKWNMPDHFYRFEREHVTFLSLDTNMIMLGLAWVRDQQEWVRAQIDGATTPWVIAFGHHPYRSNGSHGNAGNYEGLPFVPVVNGARIERFFEQELCERVDAYFAGHDHTRQWLERSCGVELIVSGAGAKTTELERRDNNPVKFEDDTTEGFFWVEIADDTMTVEIWDREGTLNHQGQVTRPSAGN